MNFSFSRAMIIARREYITTVKRPQFVFSLLFTPTLLFLITFVTGKFMGDSAKKHQRETKVIAVVDSSGIYPRTATEYHYIVPDDAPIMPRKRNSPPSDEPKAGDVVRIYLHPYQDQKVALDSLAAGNVTGVVTVAQDFLKTGAIRRYESQARVFSSSGDDRPLRSWLTRNLIAGTVDSARVDRLLQLGRTTDLYVKDHTGAWQLKDDRRELLSFFVPFILAFMLAMSILNGGQYMLTGLAEEKETRILESMLCTVTPDDLIFGKLVGLGAAGLTLVGVWVALGLASGSSMLALENVQIPASIGMLAAVYFLFGYLFFGSLMTGIGAIANNLREAQQYSMVLTLANVAPFWVLTPILNEPNGSLAVAMSLFPMTASTTMMLRLTANSMLGQTVPLWQVATSIGLLALSAFLALAIGSRIFRIGLLLYGKTPNLPEIIKLLRKA